IGLSTDAGKDLISFTSAGRVTTSLLVEGEYPKVRSLFPESVPIHAIVETAVLREAVRRVSLVAERNTPLRFEVTDGMLTLHAGTGDDAQASEPVEATLQGEEITVGFNPHYVAVGLAAVECPYVIFSFTQPMKPVIIAGQKELDAPADESYRYLLMPTRIWMWISRLSLGDFRSYPELDLESTPGITTFVADNGTGKTNIVAAT